MLAMSSDGPRRPRSRWYWYCHTSPQLAARIASLSGPVVQTGKQAVLTGKQPLLPHMIDLLCLPPEYAS